MPHQQSIGRAGYLLLTLFCLLFFGYCTIGGRPLTMHEGRLPQTTREMFHSGHWQEWIVPHNGGRPWVERPPVPHWLTALVTAPLGGPDAVWKVRLAPMLAGVAGVLLLAWMAAFLFGRSVGLLAGFAQATMFEFFSYAWLAEDDIFLTVVLYGALAVFLRLEFSPRYASRLVQGHANFEPGKPLESRHESINPIGRRPWLVLALFVLLGAGSLVKGLVFGTVMAGIPLAGYMLWNHDLRRILRYVWVWGWLALLATAAWWPLLTEHLVPGSASVWGYDLFGRLHGGYLGQKWHYYLQVMPGLVAPWTPLCLLGMVLTLLPAWRERYSPLRLVWCWGVLTVVVFSLSQSKHHHYMLHITGAWAIFAAFGMRWVWQKLPQWPGVLRKQWLWMALAAALVAALWLLRSKLLMPDGWLAALSVLLLASFFLLSTGLRNLRPGLTLGSFLAGFAGLSFFLYSGVGTQQDQTIDDTVFLQQAARTAPADAPLLLNAHHRGGMDFFRIQFYLPPRAELLHNETYLLQERFRGETVYLIDRSSSTERLAAYGTAEIVLQSARSRREAEHAGKMTLYKLKLREDLTVYPPLPISPMQAMSRFNADEPDGPLLGQPETLSTILRNTGGENK